MPYSDNLYSAEDSDTESLSDQLSPTDGYFMNRDHPQEQHLMVEDPSLMSSPSNAESKALEARQEAYANGEGIATRSAHPPSVTIPSTVQTSRTASAVATYTPSSPPHTLYTPVSPTISSRQDERYSETSALLHPNPPPAYSAATNEGNSSRPFTANYNTISSHQLEEGLGSHREPESMGGPVDLNEREPVWRRHALKFQKWHFLRNLLIGLIVLGLGIGAIVSSIKAEKSKENSDPPPWSNDPPSRGAYCAAATVQYSNQFNHLEFEVGHELLIVQMTRDNPSFGSNRVNTVGKVIVRSLAEADIGDGKHGLVTFDAWGSTTGLSFVVNIDNDQNAVRVVTEKHTSQQLPAHLSEHCISLEITVWLPPSSTFKEMSTFTETLSLEVFGDINVFVSGNAVFESFAGNVHFPVTNQADPAYQWHSISGLEGDSTEPSRPQTPPEYLHSSSPYLPSRTATSRERGLHGRRMRCISDSGSIHGTFALFDEVVLGSQSGSINATIIPQKVDYAHPQPAVLDVNSVSGNIAVRLPIDFPKRDYRTKVKSTSGSLELALYVGTLLAVETNSGHIYLNALPNTSLYEADKPKLTTNTFSGSQKIRVITPQGKPTIVESPPKHIDVGHDDPYLIPHTPDTTDAHENNLGKHTIRDLKSEHISMSGSVDVRYPDDWEGELDVSTISGSARVGGDKVRIIKDSRKDWAYAEIIGRKGYAAESASKMIVRAVSGSASVWVGN